MVSATDVLIRLKGKDETGNTFKNVENKAKGMGNAISSAFGMAMGMVGYDLMNSLAESGREAINASQNLDYFAGRLNLSADTTKKFKDDINQMQTQFRKVDMTAVGASAEEIIMKSGGAIDATSENLKNVTTMTATLSSAFVKEGRTQEDAILAVNDAMGGQFKRLQELNITEDMLKKNGWSGEISDQTTLIDALNKTMDDMGYTQTAQDIVTLDDAWQALTVSGGRLLADIIVPLTPAFLAVTDAILNTIDFIKSNGWVQGALLIGGVAAGLLLLMGAAAAAETSVLALAVSAMPGFISSLWAAAGAIGGITVAGAPLWAIVAVIAALAFAVYEVGIYFGWWKDVGTMLEAISSGVRRLWEAFINSPQVQGAIKMVKGALQDLWNYAQPAIKGLQQIWTNLFGDAGGNPDAVRIIWQAFQKVGEVAEHVFPYVQQAIQGIIYVLTPLFDGFMSIVGVLSKLSSGSISWQDAFIQVISIMGQAFANFHVRIGQIVLQIGSALLNGLINIVKQIPGRIWQFLMQAALRLLVFSNIAAMRARLAGQRILNGVINFIRQLPGRVGQFMMQVPGRIASAAGAAVGAAASLASQVVSAVTSGVTGIADKIYTEFMNIPSRINGAVSDAVSAAANFGSGIKDAVLNALHIASPGIIQRKIAIEFADIPGRIGESQDYVYSAARDYAGNILRGFNAPQMTMANMGTVRQNSNYTPNNVNGSNITIVHIHEGAVPIDARNMTKREAQGMITFAFEDIGRNPKSYGG